MAKIYYVQDKDGNTVYPVTHADAILGLEDVNVDLSAYQTKTDNNLATQSKDLVGAINELFQSADSGKELIANAIGEPVSADDTFSAMSNDINSLLSTFKTNMMNNGIAVGANDKFKQLIDKISTMTEEGQGKGIQFIQGEHVLSELLYTNNANITINTNLSFNPNYIIVYIPNITPLSVEYTNQPDVALTTDCRRMEIAAWYGSQYNYRGPAFELSYTQDTISVDIYKGATGYGAQIPAGTVVKWYAIGVGEEDTALRDSLASILENKGVDTTEEDDMASLISKVDEISVVEGAEKLPSWYRTSFSDRWIEAKELPSKNFYHSTSAIGDDIYIFGGNGSITTVSCYNTESNSWSTKQAMPQGRQRTRSSVVNGKVYVLSGFTGTNTLSTLNYCYDPTTNSWTTKTAVPEARTDHSSSAVDGKIYFMGGVNRGIKATNYCYDPATDSWTSKTNITQGRGYHSASVLDGKIYIIGGLNESESLQSTNYCYDPVTNSWTTKAAMSTTRYMHSSSAVDGKIYVLGGLNNINLNSCYDPASNSWSDKEPIPVGVQYHSSTSTNGRIYILGGYSNDIGIATNYCYIP